MTPRYISAVGGLLVSGWLLSVMVCYVVMYKGKKKLDILMSKMKLELNCP